MKHQLLKHYSSSWSLVGNLAHVCITVGLILLRVWSGYFPQRWNKTYETLFSKFLRNYIRYECKGVGPFYILSLQTAASLSFVLMILKLLFPFFGLTRRETLSRFNLSREYKRNTSRTCLKLPNTSCFIITLTNLFSYLLILSIGISRGIGLCLCLGHFFGFHISSMEVLLFILETLQVPLAMFFCFVPYTTFMICILSGFVTGLACMIIGMMLCLHPNVGVALYLENLQRQRSSTELAFRHLIILQALDQSKIKIFCRSDQKLCQLQKEILGITSNSLRETRIQEPTDKMPWIKDKWQGKYWISRKNAEQKPDASENQDVDLNHTNFYNEKEYSEHDHQMNVFFFKQFQQEKEKSIFEELTKSTLPEKTMYRLHQIESLFTQSNCSGNKKRNLMKVFEIPKNLFVECTVKPEFHPVLLPLEWEGPVEGNHMVNDLLVVCQETLEGKEFEFLMVLIEGGTSPVWRFPINIHKQSLIFSGILDLEDLEHFFLKNSLDTLKGQIQNKLLQC